MMYVVKVSVNRGDGASVNRVASFPTNLADPQQVAIIGCPLEVQKNAAIDFVYDWVSPLPMADYLHLFDRGFANTVDGFIVFVWAKDIDPDAEPMHVQ